MPVEARAWLTGEYPNQQINFDLPSGPKGDPGGFVQGALLPANTDMNTIVTDGRYRVLATAVVNGAISGNSYGTYDVTTSSGTDRLTQTWLQQDSAFGARHIKQRYLASGVWSPWRTYASTRVDNTAGRAIYQWDDLNNREQLIYGNTGLREIKTLVVAEYQATIQSLTLQRVGSTVQFSGRINAGFPTSGTLLAAGAIPVGFQYRPSVLDTSWPTHDGKITTLVGGTGLGINRATAEGTTTFTISWMTQDAWPTALPGTAIGTVPNS